MFSGLNHQRILDVLHSDPLAAWPSIERVWSWAEGVYRTPIGPSAKVPIELTLLDEMVKGGPWCEDLLLKNLLHDNPSVSAYCLLGLEKLNHPILKDLPNELLRRDHILVVHVGGISGNRKLGELAQEISNAAIGGGGA